MPKAGPWPQQINLQLCTSKHDQARGRTKMRHAKINIPSFTENLMSSVATGNVMTSSSCEWTTRHYSSPSKYRTQCVAQLKVDSAWSSSRLDTRQTSIDQVSSGQNFERSLRRRTNLIPKRRSSGLIIGPST